MERARLHDLWSADTWATLRTTTRLAFPCGGRCVAPGSIEHKAAIAYGLTLLAGCIWWAVVAAFVPLHWVFIAIGIALQVASAISYIFITLSDPGILPKHVTTLAQTKIQSAKSLSTPDNANFISPVVADLARLQPPLPEPRTVGGQPQLSEAAVQHVSPFMVKFCVTCRIWRPPGTHHCGLCDICVVGFDHHCGVIGKCVGAGNIRAFLAFCWAQTIQYGFSLVYSIAAIISVIVAEDSGVDPALWTSGRDQVALWASGGTFLGLLTCCACTGRLSFALQRPHSLFGVLTITLIGVVCPLVAYTRVSPRGTDLVPSLLAVPVFCYGMSMAGITAMGQTCLVATQETTKEKLKRLRIETIPMKESGRKVPMSTRCRVLARVACTRAPPRHVRFHADATQLLHALKQAYNNLALEAEARQAAQMRAVQCLPDDHVVNPAASVMPDAQSTQVNMPQEQQDASEVIRVPSEAAVVQVVDRPSAPEDGLPQEGRDLCARALASAVDGAYYEDAQRIATDPAVVAAAASVPGVVTGLSFLVPGLDYKGVAVGATDT